MNHKNKSFKGNNRSYCESLEKQRFQQFRVRIQDHNWFTSVRECA